MTSAPLPTLSPRARAASRWWHLTIAVVIVFSLVIQVWLILTGGPDPNTGETVATVGVATRMIQTVSFFTIQSNILTLIVAVTLVLNPDRDGRFWRILRITALLGITITGLVFDLILIHYVDPKGWQLVATIGFHYFAPWVTVLGWLLFGPRPRLDRVTMWWALVWPLAWVVYTFVRGAIVDWYPYPFLNVHDIGYLAAFRNTAIILLVGVVLLFVYRALDRFRTVGAVATKPSTPSDRALS